jgi:hypothetical protein
MQPLLPRNHRCAERVIRGFFTYQQRSSGDCQTIAFGKQLTIKLIEEFVPPCVHYATLISLQLAKMDQQIAMTCINFIKITKL